MANIYDVAKKSGYSIATVSKALNNYSDISEKARTKILSVCKEIGYMPNSSARTLPTKKSWTIGVVFSEELGVGITHPFFSHVIESFKQSIEANGYDLLFISRELGHSIYSYLEHCRYRNVDGVIVVHTDFSEPEVREILDSDLPSVVIDNVQTRSINVSSDNYTGARMAMDHLIGLGHRKIAHISGNKESYASQVRSKAYLDSMESLSEDMREGYLQSGGFFSLEGGYEAMKRLLDLEDRPTAVFVSGDYMAIGAMRAIQEAGLKIPDDISIVGFDDVEAAKLVCPGLTTVRQDTIRIGQAAAERLIERINGKSDEVNESIPVVFMERSSTMKR